MAGSNWRTVPPTHPRPITTPWPWFPHPAKRRSAADQPVRQGDLVKMALQSSERVIEKRWVYILDIDCHGKGTLLYPLDYAENQFPSAADNGRQFLLPGARTLRIGPPYGVDTLILLSTAQPLPDPYALNFRGRGLAWRAEFRIAPGKPAEERQQRNPRLFRRSSYQLGHWADYNAQCSQRRGKVSAEADVAVYPRFTMTRSFEGE